MTRPAYPNDLTDAELNVLQQLLPPEAPVGRSRKWSLREILDGIFCLLRGGIARLAMPHDFPPCQTIYHDHRLWRLQGVWAAVHTPLREWVRLREGRAATPSAAIIDSQSVKTTETGGPREYDGGKKANGCKRHLLVDTLGLVMAIKVHEADIKDCTGSVLLLRDLPNVFPRMEHLWAVAGYTGKLAGDIHTHLGRASPVWLSGHLGAKRRTCTTVEVSGGFVVLSRWVVARTFAWLGKCRRMARDDEALVGTAEDLVYEVMIRLVVRRPAKGPT